MTRTARGIAAVLATVAGLALILLATRSDRTRDVARHGSPYHVRISLPPSATASASAAVPPRAGQNHLPHWLTVFVAVVGLAIAAVVVALAVVYLVRLIRRLPPLRRRRRGIESADAGELAPENVAAALRRAVEATLQELDDPQRGDTRDAIIACWLRLEDIAADAGVPRQPAETAADLTERVLRTHRVSAGTLTRLADLYREARFSGHQLGPADRTAARAALAEIQRELAGRVGSP